MSEDCSSSDDSDGSDLDRMDASFINDMSQCTQPQGIVISYLGILKLIKIGLLGEPVLKD